MNAPVSETIAVHPVRAVARSLAGIEFWPVALCVALSVFSVRMLPVAVVVALLFWLIRWIANGTASVRTPADPAVVLLIAMLPVSLWATTLPATTLPQVYRLLTGIALFYAIVNWTTSRARLSLLIIGIVMAGLLLAFVAPVSVRWTTRKLPFLPIEFYEHFAVLMPFKPNSNVMGGDLVILLPIPLVLALAGRNSTGWTVRILSVTTAVVMSGILLLTQSRGALLALAGVVCVIAILRWRRGWLVPAALVGLGAAALVIVGRDSMSTFLNTGAIVPAAEKRLEIWSRALFMMQDFPFTGAGMGTFNSVMNTLYPLLLSPPDIPHAHNLFLQVAVDMGIPGLIAWVALLLVVIVAAWQVYRSGRATGDSWMTAIGIGILSSQTALLIHGLFDCVVWANIQTFVIVWALWGLALASRNLLKTEN